MTSPQGNSVGSDQVLDRLSALHPKMIDLSLGRVERLLATLDNPERKLPPVIHVAGTNGKGSTIAMIRAGLEAAGQTVHVYTSPHLVRFHERIRVAGQLIDEDLLLETLERCERANDGAPITYFEITTCAALLAFAETPADAVLLEVGLGGRLDTTNVIDHPKLCVITPIDIDHQQFLGETLGEIAGEKAGILKPGAPAVIAYQQDTARDVIEARAEAIGATLSVGGQDWAVWTEHGRLVFQDLDGLLDLPLPALLGPHQVSNTGTALAALRNLGVDEAACEAALTNAKWPARMQRITDGHLLAPLDRAELWIDGGHNPAAGRAIASTLAELPDCPTYLVCGMLDTKDIVGFLRPLAAHARELFAVNIPDTPAALPAETIAGHAGAAGITACIAASIEDALGRPPAGSRIIICGSLYVAGAALKQNGTRLD